MCRVGQMARQIVRIPDIPSTPTGPGGSHGIRLQVLRLRAFVSLSQLVVGAVLLISGFVQYFAPRGPGGSTSGTSSTVGSCLR